jgi:hypothetical protein
MLEWHCHCGIWCMLPLLTTFYCLSIPESRHQRATRACTPVSHQIARPILTRAMPPKSKRRSQRTRRPPKSRSDESDQDEKSVSEIVTGMGGFTTTQTEAGPSESWTGFTVYPAQPVFGNPELRKGKSTSTDALAREALRQGTLNGIQGKIQQGVNHVLERIHATTGKFEEPGYLARDEFIIEKTLALKRSIKEFAMEFFHFELSDSEKSRTEALKQMMHPTNAPLGVVVDDVATCGPTGKDGWTDYLTHADLRVALVRAVIARLLLEHVLKNAGFGCTEQQKADLRENDIRMLGSSGMP